MTRLGTTIVTLSVCMIAGAGTARAAGDDVVDINEPLVAASATPIADFLRTTTIDFSADPQDARPVAIEYSDAHYTRAKIHKYASWAVLPLMATEFALGQKLYSDPNFDDNSHRGLHGTIGAALIGLYAVQSVTGVWNLLEASGEPGHKKRLVHGLLMLGAEGGFIAAAAMAPNSRTGGINFDAERSTHRNVAIVSIGVGTAGYLLMLLTGGNH